MWQYSVVRIVREKMLRTEAFSDPEQLQAFLSQLYVFLVDEMHASLNKVMTQNINFCYSSGEALLLLKLRLIDLNKPLTFIVKPWWCFISVCVFHALIQTLSADSQDAHQEPVLSCAQLKHFAREAELNTDYQLAAQYYLEVKQYSSSAALTYYHTRFPLYPS